MCLGAATEVKKQIDEGLEVRNSQDRFRHRRKACLHVRQRCFCQVGHGDTGAGEMGKVLPQQWGIINF